MSPLNKNIKVIFVWVRCNYCVEMTYISTREATEPEVVDPPGGDDAEDEVEHETETTPTNDILKLSELDIDERYLEFMDGICTDANDYISAYMCSYAVDKIPCIGMTRKHGLHDQLNTIIKRLNEMEKLLAAIARNTQAISCTKTIVGGE